MTDELKKFVNEQAAALTAAPSCYSVLKEKAAAWLADGSAEAAAALLEEAEADICPIDGLIALAGSEKGEAIFGGKEAAAGVVAAAEAHKAEGGKYCICGACAACEALLAKKSEILGA